MTNLNLVANLGLTLFLFIIGLEVDLRFLLSNWKVAMWVGEYFNVRTACETYTDFVHPPFRCVLYDYTVWAGMRHCSRAVQRVQR
jgi:hypothetical protein